MRVFVAIAVAMTFFRSANAETIGDWNTGWGQGVAEYWTSNSNGDRLGIDCGDRPMGPAVDVRISVNGQDIQDDKSNRFVGFRIGAREGSLTYNESGRLNTFCVACISNYELFWQMLKNGKSVVFQLSNGRNAEFSLRVCPESSYGIA